MRTLGLILILVMVMAMGAGAQKYVRPAADGGNDANSGDDWDNAYATIGQAISVAATDIRVALGSYTLSAPLVLPQTVSITGGYDPATDTRAPDPSSLATLSVLDGGGAVDHAVDATFGGAGSWAVVIDGMAIQNFNADGAGNDASGAGIIFSGGAGAIQNCRFQSNTATTDGGGIFFLGTFWGDSSVTNCTFVDNTAGNRGGAIAVDYGLWNAIVFSGCTFTGNNGGYGGAISHYYGNVGVDVVDSVFTENTAATDLGGAVFFEGATADYTNCVFWNNGTYYSGGIYAGVGASTATNANLTNCTFSNSQVAAQWTSGSAVATANVRNCIAYDHPEALAAWSGAVTNAWDSCVQGGNYNDISGNFSDDPLFADSGTGDLRITGGSPCLDLADAGWAPAADIRGVARPVGAGSDIGAYEYFGPSAPDLLAASDLGVADDDDLTSDVTPDFEGTGVDGTTVTLSSDVDGAVGSAVVASGAWTVTASTLTAGVHQVTASAVDTGGSGLTSVPSTALAVTIDDTGPNCTAITPSEILVADQVDFYVDFDGDVVNFDAASDLVINESGGVAHGGVLVTSTSAFEYTVYFTGLSGNGTLSIAVSTGSDVQDAAGNALDSSVTSANVTVDNGGDLDHDGMPDDWEELYGFDPLDPDDADFDYDNDGRTNLQEYLDGSDPTNPASRLPVAGVAGLLVLFAIVGAAGVTATRRRN